MRVLVNAIDQTTLIVRLSILYLLKELVRGYQMVYVCPKCNPIIRAMPVAYIAGVLRIKIQGIGIIIIII